MTIVDYLDAHDEPHLEDLFELLRIPSISTDVAYKKDVRRCADWLASHLEKIGVEKVSISPTDGHPIVYARTGDDPDKKTYILYGHYDVQPPDPLELWDSPPFEPTLTADGRIVARGATDDKGQFFAHIKAIEAHLAVHGELPVNLILVIEGEEEVGSTHLEPWLRDYKEELKAEAVIISDTSMYGPGRPAIVYGLRGLSYMEVEVTGPSHDLHSGMFGGGIRNPVNALAAMIGSLHDADGRVTVPGFYDDVVALTEQERESFRALDFDDEGFRSETGAAGLYGEAGFTTLERIWARPTLDCNGIVGGYTGDGAKTVLPSKARAKFSCRLVPDQRPQDIEEKVRAYFEKIKGPGVTLTWIDHHGGTPVVTNPDHPAIQASVRALEAVWGVEPVFIRGGGSIPVVASFDRLLATPSVLLGFGLSDDRLHSPNEKFDLLNWRNGIRTSARLWNELA